MTNDQGATWRKFDTLASPDIFRAQPMNFHGRDAKKVIWNGEECVGLLCEQAAFYTDDDFESIHVMGTMTRGCYWAVATPQFGVEIRPEIKDRIFCIVQGLYSPWPKDNRLIVSDDFFDKQEIEPQLDDGRAVTGVISLASVKGYLVAAAKSEGTDELALFVTDDASQWHRAEFGQHRIEEEAYTILESTNYSMQVDVLGSRPQNPVGYLFTSNSNGTFFTRTADHTNRDIYGRVDFEKISNIPGIILINQIDNWKEVEQSSLEDKEILSQISFDDGRTFQDLMVGDRKLHLHSVTESRQEGRIFSSPAPGIAMGIGNTGKYLTPYEDGNLYVSDDAGVTWIKALNGPHLYEFGNQGAVIVAISEKRGTTHFQYSTDHGKKWTEVALGMTMEPKVLTTAPDSTTLKFVLMGLHREDGETSWQSFKIDFEGLNQRNCKESDFERWAARLNEDGKPSCLMGHRTFFRRRKADAKCFIEKEFLDPEPEYERCECTRMDFECDYNFGRNPEDRSVCSPSVSIPIPAGACKKESDTFESASGWRLIPGNDCMRKGGVELDKDIQRPCNEGELAPPPSKNIESEKTHFDGRQFAEWIYLEKGGNIDAEDESIIMRTSDDKIFRTSDHGKTWLEILKGKNIESIVPNPNNHDVVFFLTAGRKIHYTIDRGERLRELEAPEPPSSERLPKLKFHPDPKRKDWLLWSGSVGNDDHTNVFFTRDRGDDWRTIAKYAKRCEFIGEAAASSMTKDKNLVYCEQYEDEDPKKKLQLLSSTDFDDWKVQFEDILDFATMSEFIIVAAKSEDRQSLKVDASVDGHTFAAAEFPKNFQPDHQQAYTVLDSSTHAVFLHVTVSTKTDGEYGTIIKSNSNGTSYVLTANAVNRDENGYVDFEKMHGLEGVAMINVVSNVRQVDGGEKKKLKSMITHNDGGEWAFLPPPKKRAAGGQYKCVGTENKATEKCSLHLHSYTERSDKSATFSSQSAIGLMMAVGNVGDQLLPKDSDQTDTFLTRDAGVTWTSVKKGSYLWEYGDQGSIIVIVKRSLPTKILHYSLDEGNTWQDYQFSDVDMQIDALSTVPSDRSMNFLLWGIDRGDNPKKGIFTVNVDFTGLDKRQRQCILDEGNPVNKDYVLWEPKHPTQDSNCLFGHISQYHRKRTDIDCANGKQPIQHIHNIAQNCTCTRQDFECDYNYEMRGDGSCTLVPGLQPADHAQKCRDNPDQIEFWYPTGYRRIPMTTCQGGRQLDKSEALPCSGHEDEYNQKHGLSGAGLFFAIMIPVAVAVGVGYWVYTRWQDGFANFGQIRLGESISSEGGGQNPLVAVPVALVAGVVAVAKATPLLLVSLFRSAKGYVPVGGGASGRQNGFGDGPYRSRDAFARRGQDYSSVVEDDELLGEEGDGEDEV